MRTPRYRDRVGRAFDSITDSMREFIEAQHVFFVATAPSEGGHVNLSPKGYDSFRLLDANRVAYLDLTGSGAETIAHVRQNGRVTFMFCAFEGKPNIVRLYGAGRVVFPTDADFAGLRKRFAGSEAEAEGAVRSIIVVDVDRTSSSCGFSIPFMDYVDDRPRLLDWGRAKSDEQIADYWREKNTTSIDGIPAIDHPV